MYIGKYKIRIWIIITLVLIPVLANLIACQTKQINAPLLQHVSLAEDMKKMGDNDGYISVNELDSLRKKYPRIFEIWFNEIMQFPAVLLPTDSAKAEVLTMHYKKNGVLYPIVDEHFKKYPNLHQDIANAFEKLFQLLPNMAQPVLVTYYSEFGNTSTFVDSFNGKNMVAYSPECFLDDTFSWYKSLNDYPAFMNRYNNTNQIPSTLVLNYLKSHYDSASKGDKMIDEMLLEGKMWYTLQLVLNDDEFYEHIGYTKKEWEFLRNNEGQIWHHYMINKMLFSTNFKDYLRYFNFGNKTFGGGIPEDCPPRIGCYSGYKMVKALMDKNQMTIAQLWAINDGAKALQMAGYNPKK